MSEEKNHRGLLLGAAVVAGILGTLSAIASTNRTARGWAEQARDATSRVLEKGDAVNKNMLLGGVAGGLIGAATALLLAPRSGTDLIKELTHPFSKEERKEHGRSKSHKLASRKKGKKHKEASHSIQEEGHHKKSKRVAKAKSHKSAAVKKKTSTRRRTAKVAVKQAAVPEKADIGISAVS